MRVLACFAVVAAAESDQESLLQTSSIRRHLQNLGQGSSEEQLLATVRSQLESRANSAQTLEYFDAAMNSKNHKEKACDAEQIEELSQCLQVGDAQDREGKWHLSDAIAGQMSATDITEGLETFGCDTLVSDMGCFRRSECYETIFGEFDFNITVPMENTTATFSAKQICGQEANASSMVGEACALSPKAMCEKFAASENLGANNTCQQEGCEALNEVEGLAIAPCADNATTATDHFIRTKAGCKAAVQAYSDGNLDALNDASEKKVTIKFGKKLAKWMRTATKPMGCYLYYKGRHGTKIRGYFNAHSKLTDQETRKGETIGNGKKQRQPLCKTFA